MALAVLLAAALAAALAGDGRRAAERVETGLRARSAPGVSVLAEAYEAPASPPTTVRPTTTVAPRRQPAAPAPPTTTSATVTTLPAVTSTVAPAVATTVTPVTSAPTTSSTVSSCRNSTDPACGPFRFDPQPGPDSPMTVQVAVEPAEPVAGQEVVFRLTLTDPDGVSYNATTFGFGDGGIGGASFPPCERFGAWDPPPRDGATTEVVEVAHTYANPGTYAVSFLFEAGPFSCIDSVSGRGDRPYASSATGTATVVVG